MNWVTPRSASSSATLSPRLTVLPEPGNPVTTSVGARSSSSATFCRSKKTGTPGWSVPLASMSTVCPW
jgi:hypothetical protein